MALTQQQIDEAFAAMGLAPPSSALLGSLEGISNNYTALNTIIALPQVQTSVIPVVAMFDLALGHDPVSSTLASIVESNLSQSDLATAFVSSQAFANVYNGSVLLNPTTLITSANDSIITALFQNGLGHPPTQNTLNGFHGLTLSQAFLAFVQSQAVGVSATIDSSLLSILELATGVPAQAATPVSLALTVGLDTNTSLTGSSAAFGANVTVTGQIDSGPLGDNAIWTFQPGDNLTFAGGTLSIVDLNHAFFPAVTNELAGITITGPFAFNVQEESPFGGLFDFSTNGTGVTQATSVNSAGNVTFANMPTGSVVASSGSATTAPDVFYSYATPSTAPSLTVDSGVSGVTFVQVGASAKPTSATINSTGAANGKEKSPTEVTKPDAFNFTSGASGTSVASLTVNAATNLIGELFFGDYKTGASLTVTGNASYVQLESFFGTGAEVQFGSVNASGLAGGLTMDSDSALKTFVGGAGGGSELLRGNESASGQNLSTSATSINGGGGIGNVLSADLVTGTNAGIFTNWQILDVTNLQNVTGQALNTNIMANDAITGLQFSAHDFNGDTVLNIAANSTLAINGSDWTVKNNITGASDTVQYDALLTQTHLGGSGTTAVTFANEDTTSTDSLYLNILLSTGDTAVSIQSNGGGFDNGIGILAETDNHLTTVTMSGANYASLGLELFANDIENGVRTDTDNTHAPAPGSTSIASSLTTIDASGTTGGVFISAGDTSSSPGSAISYTGLQILGGTGTDSIYNGAKSGSIVDGSGNHDFDGLGHGGGSIMFGAGAGDTAYIGVDVNGDTASIANGHPVPTLGPGTYGTGDGNAIGDAVTFGAGATGTVELFTGAENGQGSIGDMVTGNAWTSVTGAVAGTALNFTHTGITTSLVLNYALTAADTNLTKTFTDAYAAVGGTSAIVVFTFGGNEFVIGHHGGVGFTPIDAVVELVGVSNEVIGATAGVAHLA